MITASINVSLLDKAKFIEGKKGKYCNLVLIETPNGKYGDYMIKQDSSKEERENGVQMPILGNAKIRERKQAQPAQSKPKPQSRQADPDLDPEDDIPF